MPIPTWTSLAGRPPLKPRARACSPWLAFPPLLSGTIIVVTLALSKFFHPEPLEARLLAHQDRIAARLTPGEAGLPDPAPFARQAADPAHQGQDWEGLPPGFKGVLQELLARMESRGYDLAFLEGSSDPEPHTLPTHPRRQVVRGQAHASLHQAPAADLGLVRNGELVLPGQDPWTRQAYEALGEEAESLGLVWGGRRSFKDLGHVEAPLQAVARPWTAPVRALIPSYLPWEQP